MTKEVIVHEFTREDGDIIPVVTSREVGDTFDRHHRHVLDSIRNLMGDISSEISEGEYFIESSYQHPTTGLEVPEYYLTRDGFTLLVMGFTGSKALDFKIEYLRKFNEMEAYIKEQQQPVTETTGMIDSKMMYQIAQTLEEKEKQVKWQQFQIETQSEYIEEQEAYIEQQDEYIEDQQPKVLFADSVSVSEETILIGELAKILKQNGIPIGQNRLFKWLRYKGYLLSHGSYYNTPSQSSMERGLFKIQQRTVVDSYGRVQLQRTPKITGKGQLYFISKLTKLHHSGVLEKQMASY